MTESPRTPAPRLVSSNGVDRIVPSLEFLDMSKEDLALYQENALEMIDELRRQVMDGEAIGFVCASIAVDSDGRIALRQCFTSGASAMPFQSVAAIEFLRRSFHANFFDE